jgi:hemoglobin
MPHILPLEEESSVTVPTLYEWIGGIDALNRLTDEFYRRVHRDELLAPVFAGMDEGHPRHVAMFLAEVLGGPPLYSGERGGHPEMVRHHLGKHLSETMRRRWINLLLDTYTDLELPADPEFASALVGYLEWGTRLAVINSQPGANLWENAPMPKWGWGETGGPWIPKKA